MLYEIIVDSGETPNKCTITPLSHREDFRLFRVRGEAPIGPLTAPLLLHHEGECLTQWRRESRPLPHAMASIDCVWRRLPILVKRIAWTAEPKHVRIPDGFVTAYPRVAKYGTDPGNGLATIEAIFIASAALGMWDPTLLSKYYFGRRFIELNVKRFQDLSAVDVSDPANWPELPERVRNSRSRRQTRLEI